ncbi:hypothetical protein JQ631_30020 [Bradyrhizobium manausense]|uniref:hypothetical protein n=1 Tax=Bradyrhizobium manausense TaxID=989370 RepID=UPI001BA6BD1E|nr:hypothetical protein [Bradyrhizobium manausense]MBR0793335.1 hypothetical protein [Bradyrhizobium manausense]
MFRGKTAFVIGAGAGVDISMPTGKALIEEIEKRLTFGRAEQGSRRGLNGERLNDAILRASAMRKIDTKQLFGAAASIAQGAHHMGSIDTYIHAHGHNELIKLVGKMAIVDVILDYERKCDVFIDWTKHPFNFKNEEKVRKSWLATFMNSLVQGVTVQGSLDSIFNSIAIINFNYDRCVEQYLWKSLQRSFGVPEERASELMSKLVIHHPYGAIADLKWKGVANGLHLGGDPHDEYCVDIDLLSQGIKTFNEEVSGGGAIEEVRTFLEEAKHVVFLGFHFHRQNVELIAPKSHGRKIGVKHAYASTYGRSAPEKAVIESQVNAMFHETAQEVWSHLDILECGKLLADYGTTFAA